MDMAEENNSPFDHARSLFGNDAFLLSGVCNQSLSKGTAFF